MPTVLNSNFAASSASLNLSRARDGLSMSLERLSSGKRINSESNNAGGLTMAYKTKGERSRTLATMISIRNALSFLQVQDGAMSTVGKVFSRMSQLRTMATVLPSGVSAFNDRRYKRICESSNHSPSSDRDVPTSKHKQ